MLPVVAVVVVTRPIFLIGHAVVFVNYVVVTSVRVEVILIVLVVVALIIVVFEELLDIASKVKR